MTRRSKADDGLRSIITSKLKDPHWQPIETWSIAAGVADLNGCLSGVEAWVECKSASAWAVKFEPGQIPWINRRTRAGGRVTIAVRRRHSGGPRLGDPVDELWLIPGSAVIELARDGLKEVQLRALVFHKGPSKWDWSLIQRKIFGV